MKLKHLKLKNNILKANIKASKRPIKVLVQRQNKFTWKKINIDEKMKFYTGIAPVTLFNAIFALIKPYITHITYWKGPKRAMQILKRTGKKKMPTS